MSGLEARVRARRGPMTIDAQLNVPDGRTIALLGPNGAGKSTLVSALAGLVPLETGYVRVDSETWDDTSRGIRLVPQARRASVMFQGLRLFPWMHSLDNVAYPLRRARQSRRAARQAAAGMLDSLGIGEVADKRPDELSGGEAQRVALARALVIRPMLLLLDEPLSDLDATSRVEVRHLLRDHLGAFAGAAILVTHDHLEAAALADEVIVLEDGQVTQSGSFEELAARPRSAYIAGLRGTNLYRGRGMGTTVKLERTSVVVADDAPSDSLVAIDPRSVTLHVDEPKGSARNAWHLTVSHVELLERSARVALTGDLELVAEVTPGSLADLTLEPNTRVWASVKATEVSVYPE